MAAMPAHATPTPMPTAAPVERPESESDAVGESALEEESLLEEPAESTEPSSAAEPVRVLSSAPEGTVADESVGGVVSVG